MAPTTSSSVYSLGWSWDVFLSFRDEDTRFTFTDHLHSALCRKGIRTFRDDEGLDRGEEIGSSLLKAIEESRMYIVVFSKAYAHSKWCLDELAKIMECKTQKGLMVVPVFYHVDPSHVRNQRRSFGEAFDKYQKVPEDKVMRWKAALTEAANLSGYHVQDGYVWIFAFSCFHSFTTIWIEFSMLVYILEFHLVFMHWNNPFFKETMRYSNGNFQEKWTPKMENN